MLLTSRSPAQPMRPPQPVQTCCCFHPMHPHLYVSADNCITEYDLVTGHVLGSRLERFSVTDLLSSRSLSCLVALVDDRSVRVYKELGMHGGNGLRPAAHYLCTRQGRDDELVRCCALNIASRQGGGRCTFFYGKTGHANVYAMSLYSSSSSSSSVGAVVKVAGCKKVLRTEPHIIVCHPSMPLFVAASDSSAVVGSDQGQTLFELNTGPSPTGRLHSLSFDSTQTRMLGACGHNLLLWDASSTTSFNLLARVQAASDIQGAMFMPGLSPYVCTTVLTGNKSAGTIAVNVAPWYIDEGHSRVLMKSVALDTSNLSALAAQYAMQNRFSLFAHPTLPAVVALGRDSFSIVSCTDKRNPTTATPICAPLHLSVGMVTVEAEHCVKVFPSRAYFMQGSRVWAYHLASGSCEVMEGVAALPPGATTPAQLQHCYRPRSGGEAPVFVVTAHSELDGGGRDGSVSLVLSGATGGGQGVQRHGSRDTALFGAATWDPTDCPSPPWGAAQISIDGLHVSFVGQSPATDEMTAARSGTHPLGCAVRRVFATPFSGSLLYIDNMNNVRFSRNACGTSCANPWAVWQEGPGLRLHGDESVVQAVWQADAQVADGNWRPTLALVTTRRVMLLSADLEVLAHSEGTPNLLGTTSGVWCGVIFLYTTPRQIRWLALNGADSGLVALPKAATTLFGVLSDRVLVLSREGHRVDVHAIPVRLFEPLAIGWIAAALAGTSVSFSTAVRQVDSLAAVYGGSRSISPALLQAIIAAADALDTPNSAAETVAKERFLSIGKNLAFSSRGKQLPLELRLTIALRCRSYALGFEALKAEWIQRSQPTLAAQSALARLFRRLGVACERSGSEPAIAAQCAALLRDGRHLWQEWHQEDPSSAPQTFLDVLERQATLLPALVAPTSAAGKPGAISASVSMPPSGSCPFRLGLVMQCMTDGTECVAVAPLCDGSSTWKDMAGTISRTVGSNPRSSARSSSTSAERLAFDLESDEDTMYHTQPAGAPADERGAADHNKPAAHEGTGNDELGLTAPATAPRTAPTSSLASADWRVDSDSSDDDDDDDYRAPKRISISIKPRESLESGALGRMSIASVLDGLPPASSQVPQRRRTASALPPPPRSTSALPPPPRSQSLALPSELVQED